DPQAGGQVGKAAVGRRGVDGWPVGGDRVDRLVAADGRQRQTRAFAGQPKDGDLVDIGGLGDVAGRDGRQALRLNKTVISCTARSMATSPLRPNTAVTGRP